MKVHITAYKGALCIETQEPIVKDETFVPAGGGNFGCVLMDTKTNLGVSQEALVLLRRVRKNRDSMGDVMWWPVGDKFCFGWMGGPLALKVPGRITGDRDYAVREGAYTLIQNDVPEGAQQAINAW